MSEIVKVAWAKLYAWALPSALMLGAYWLLVPTRSSIVQQWLSGTTEAEKAAIFIALSGGIAFCLNTFSTPLYRLLEGYSWPEGLRKWGVQRQKKRKEGLAREVAAQSGGWRQGLAQEKLDLYPLRDEQIVPSRFGNAIRSFETYGKTRFNLDSQTLWHELLAVAPKYIQDEIVAARSSVDFLVASIYLSVIFGLVTFPIRLCDRSNVPMLALSLSSFILAFLCHRAIVHTTGEWAYTVKALVNVGRLKLAEELGLQLPDNLEQEKKMWGLVTRYVAFSDPAIGRDLDQFRKQRRPDPNTMPV